MRPAKTRDYLGKITDTRVWDDFQFRPGDIVLSTPPKCGTTWSQAILMMLIAGEAVTDRQIWHESLWLDCGFRDQSVIASKLDAMTGRRCIKSHAPFDGIPFAPETTYIAVYRHPIDVHFSMKTHGARMNSDLFDHMVSGDVSADFRRFVDAPLTDSGTDDLTVASIVHHYLSFRRFADLPNVHLAHYADLTRDLPGMIRRYAEISGLPVTDRLADAIARATDFKAMKTTATNHTRPEGGLFDNDGDFYADGSSNKWVGALTDAEVAYYSTRLAEILPDEKERRWLEQGGHKTK